jgi:hypothetical protein
MLHAAGVAPLSILPGPQGLVGKCLGSAAPGNSCNPAACPMHLLQTQITLSAPVLHHQPTYIMHMKRHYVCLSLTSSTHLYVSFQVGHHLGPVCEHHLCRPQGSCCEPHQPCACAQLQHPGTCQVHLACEHVGMAEVEGQGLWCGECSEACSGMDDCACPQLQHPGTCQVHLACEHDRRMEDCRGGR